MWKRFLISVFLLAVLLNYVWELAQAPLYVGLNEYNRWVLWHCFVASLGDGGMVLLIVAVGWIIFKRSDWVEQPGVDGYIVMLVTGLILALFVEWLGLHVLGRWQYSTSMPLLPGLEIGVAPIAQMLLLPASIFRVVIILNSKT